MIGLQRQTVYVERKERMEIETASCFIIVGLLSARLMACCVMSLCFMADKGALRMQGYEVTAHLE